MKKVEYGDFYKFLASLGVTIIGATLLLAWLFLKEPFTWISQIAQISNLDNKTQMILEQKQNLLLRFLNFFDYFIVGALVIGLLFLCIGIFLWFRIQLAIDKNQILTNKKIEKELENMTVEEIVEGVIADIEESNSNIHGEGETAQINNTDAKDGINQINYSNNSINIIQDYMRMESLVYNKLHSCFRNTNIVLRNQRIGRNEYDIIVKGNNSRQSDVIIEIKCFTKSFNQYSIRQALRQVQSASQVYTNNINRISIPIVIGVLSRKSVMSDENFEEHRNSEFEKLKIEGIQGRVILLSEKEIERISNDDFIRMLNLENFNSVA